MKRKLWLVAVLVLCLVFAVGILAACNESGGSEQQTPGGEDPGTETPGDNPGGEDPGDETVSFTVTFDTQGGSALADITVENGQVIGEFTLPTKQCSRLVGFALDTAGEQMWNVLTDTVSANITLYAIWEDAHTWGEWADTTPATCTENGERTRECEVCGATESEVIPAAHTWGEWTETIAPGCETEGERSHSCEVCGKTESETIDALGHDYSEEYAEDIAPTCEHPGSESRHCTRCDATTDSRNIAPLGHDYEGAEWHHNNANHWRYCNRCGEESERENHIFDDSGVCECGMIEIAPVSEFRFISLGNNTWRLANYTGNRTNVSIPSTYNNGTVVAISDDAFSGNTAMQTLVIPDTVTSIGARAFSDCVNLISVTLSKNLTSIGEDAFTGCTQITSATIPGMAAASIDKGALTTLRITVGYVEGREFENCSSLTTVIIDEDVTSIGGYCFSGCSSLSSVEISCALISPYAFENCTKLVSVKINDGVQTIGSFAFLNCTGISEISVPDSVTNIGNGAFSGCSGFVEMALPFVGGSAGATTPSASTLFGYIFGSSSFPGAFETVQLYGIGEGESATYYIPRYLTSVTVNGEILFGAFYGCDRIEKITLTSATDLGDYAFYNNTSLTEITIPDSVESIGEMTFAYCTSLEDIDFPQSIKTVDINAMMESAWYDAQPDGVIYIGKAVYGNKGKMPSGTSIELKDDTYSITAGAFSGCTNLTAVTIPDSVSEIGDGAFGGCTNITTATIPAAAIDYIPQNKLDTVSITSGAIGDNAFEGCTSLRSITIENGVTSIGNRAFYNCTGLAEINWNVVAEKSISLGNNIFYSAGTFGSGITVNFCDGVTRIPSNLFYENSSSYGPKIIKIIIGSSVTSIGGYAFYGCADLTEIYYTGDVAGWCGISGLDEVMSSGPVLYIGGEKVEGDLVILDGVMSIGSYAFRGCSRLTSITIPDSVTSIGDYAFYNCSGLTSVTMGNGVTSIGNYAFNGCIAEIIWGDNPQIAELGSYAFSGYEGTSITIPDSVTSIGSGAFLECSSLESITIPFVGAEAGKTSSSTYQYPFGYIFGTSSYTGGTAVTQKYHGSSTSSTASTTYYIPSSLRNVTVIGGNILYGAFYNCIGLTSVTIGNGVTSIGYDAFYGCNGLTSIVVEEGNLVYHSAGNCLIETASKTLVLGCSASVIPDDGSVTSIGSYAFCGCSGLTSITIPDSVTSIGDDAFRYCSGLTSVTIGNSVTSIGDYAFDGCSGLTSITIPDSVTSIGSAAFYNCSGLTSITIPDSVTSIGGSAFQDCSGLTSITIPDSVTSIGSTAFSGCSSLESITIPFVGASAGKTSSDTYQYPFGYIFGRSSYTGGTRVTQKYHGSSTSSITSTTYYIPSSLRSVTVTGGNILYGAFYNCSMLTSVTIGNGVTSIGSFAFEGCTGLTSITIPDSVTSIGSWAFSGCTGLTTVTIGDSVTSIGDYAFYDCDGLTSVIIPDSVTSIGDSAFSGCTGLTSVTFEGTVAEWNAINIGYYWNYNCPFTEVVCSDGTVSV